MRMKLWLAVRVMLICAGGRAGWGQMVILGGASNSSDNSANGFSVRREPAAIKDALEDFERYRDKKAWDKAIDAFEKMADQNPSGLVEDKDTTPTPCSATRSCGPR